MYITGGDKSRNQYVVCSDHRASRRASMAQTDIGYKQEEFEIV